MLTVESPTYVDQHLINYLSSNPMPYPQMYSTRFTTPPYELIGNMPTQTNGGINLFAGNFLPNFSSTLFQEFNYSHGPEHIAQIAGAIIESSTHFLKASGGLLSVIQGYASKIITPPNQFLLNFNGGKPFAIASQLEFNFSQLSSATKFWSNALSWSEAGAPVLEYVIRMGAAFLEKSNPCQPLEHSWTLAAEANAGVGSILGVMVAMVVLPEIALFGIPALGTSLLTIAISNIGAGIMKGIWTAFFPPPSEIEVCSPGESSQATTRSSQVGGVLFDNCATVIGELPQIKGAYWDSGRSVLVLFSGDDMEASSKMQLTAIEFDHLMVALRAALAGEHIGVSIDPPKEYRDGIHQGVFPPAGTEMYVSYLGNTEGTMFGAIMFESDRVMKCLSKATDNVNGHPLKAKNVQGYKSMFELFNQYKSGGSGSWFRFWFVIDKVEIAHDSTTKALRFGDVCIKVLNETELAGGEKAKQDPASEAFAKHLTEHLDDYAKEFPIFERLREIAKISALARFLVKEGIAIDAETIFKHPILPVVTPETTPGIQVSAPSVTGGYQCLFGGVDMNVDPVIISKNDSLAEDFRKSAESARSGDSATTWNFNGPDGPAIACSMKLGKVKKPYLALASSDHVFQQSWINSVRSVQRYYDSSIPSGDFGSGWWLFLPYRLQVIPSSRKRPEVTLQSEERGDNSPSVLVLHNFINRGSQIYRRYQKADNANGVAYCRLTHQELLKNRISFSVKESDVIHCLNGIYSYSDGKLTFRFDNKGQLRETRTADGILASYKWSDGLLNSIDFGGGRSYQINYNRNFLQPRIGEIVASDGVALKYLYTSDGLLAECFKGNSRKVSYRYDQQMRVTETRNGDGVVVKRTAYDSNGNAVEGTNTSTCLSDGTNLNKELSEGRITSVSDEAGGKANYSYRKDGTLAAISGIVSGKEHWRLEYDEQGKLVSTKDSQGVVYKISYYADGQVKQIGGDNGFKVQLPALDEIKKDLCGSIPNVGDWTVKRNNIGLPETIIDSEGKKHHFRYNKKGLHSIKSPGCSFDVLRNNGVAEFRTKSDLGIKQNIILDRHNAKAEFKVEGPEKGERHLYINENGYKIQDCAGTAEYKFDKDELTCEAIFEF
jgi:YD repeat-containing protein